MAKRTKKTRKEIADQNCRVWRLGWKSKGKKEKKKNGENITFGSTKSKKLIRRTQFNSI